MGKILLGADTESLVRPGLIGLEDVNLDAQEWLVPVPSAVEAREYACSGGSLDEAWVVSSDDVSGINLAAALRADNSELPVYLVAFEPSGSDASRARQAGISGILSASGFRERFTSMCKRRAVMRKVAELEPCGGDADHVDRADCDDRVGSSAEAVPVIEAAPAVEAGALKLVLPLAPKAEAASDVDSESSVPESGREQEPSGEREPVSASEPAPARERPLAPPRKDSKAFVLSVLSGSGGVGKSATAAVAAFLCAARGFKTVVVDCDLQFGDMKHLMGKVAMVGVDEVLEDPSKAASLAAELRDGEPALAFAPDRLERSEELGCHIAELLDAFSAEFDVVIANTGPSWSEGHAQLLERSHCSVFLLDQRASSVRSCQHALDLCLRLGIATGSFVYALNRCERGSLFCAVDIANVMHGAQVFELKDGGTEVEELLGAGLADELVSSKNDFCASVGAMLDEVLP